MKISFIIPCYNSELYLGKCLESLHIQKYDDLEFIIIDDGSSDSSYQIIDKYLKLDNRFSCFQKENGGIGSAYNLALKHVSGEYITFLDSDDWIHQNAIEIILESLNRANSDVILFDINIINESSILIRKLFNFSKTQFVNGNANCIKFYYNNVSDPTLFKVFHKKLFDNVTIFDQNIGIDEMLTPQLIYKSESISIIPIALWNLYWRDQSVSRSTITVKTYSDTLKIYHFLIGFWEKKDRRIQKIYRDKLLNFLLGLVSSKNIDQSLRAKYKKVITDILILYYKYPLLKVSLYDFLKYGLRIFIQIPKFYIQNVK